MIGQCSNVPLWNLQIPQVIKYIFSEGGSFKLKFKNLPRPLFRPGSAHVCKQKTNPSRDPVSIAEHSVSIFERYYLRECLHKR